MEKDFRETPSVWTWRVRLAEEGSDRYAGYYDFFLGEDEKGIYLSPRPFKSEANAVLKFRKVSE